MVGEQNQRSLLPVARCTDDEMLYAIHITSGDKWMSDVCGWHVGIYLILPARVIFYSAEGSDASPSTIKSTASLRYAEPCSFLVSIKY